MKQKTAERLQRQLVAPGNVFDQLAFGWGALHYRDVTQHRHGTVMIYPIVLRADELKGRAFRNAFKQSATWNSEHFGVVENPLVVSAFFNNMPFEIVGERPQHGIREVFWSATAFKGRFHQRKDRKSVV